MPASCSITCTTLKASAVPPLRRATLILSPPVSMLDPGQLERTVADLKAAEDKRQTVDPTLGARLVLDRLAVERSLGPTESAAGARGHGLLDAGLDALLEMLRPRAG